MDLLRLVLEDFMGHRFTDIDCTKFSTVLIVGKNKNNDGESNAAGKSTIFKAVDYVFFGEYSSGIILDELVRDDCNKCSVTVEFSVSNEIYKITRVRNRRSKKSELSIWEKRGSIWESIGQKTPSEIETELSKIIKISYKAFKNSVLFAQADLNGLASATGPEDRKIILKEALGLADYSKMEKIAKEDVSELNKKIIAQRAIFSSLGSPADEIDSMNLQMSTLITNCNSKEKERDLNQFILIDLRAKLKELETSLSSEASSIHEKLIEIKQSKIKLNQNINKIANNISDKNLILKKELNQLQIKSESLQKSINKEQILKNTSLRNPDIIQKEIDTMSTNEMNGRAYISTQENKIKELRLPIPEGEDCPHCRQTLTKEHRNICIQKDKEEIEKIEKDLVIACKRLESVRVKKNNLAKELFSIQELQKNLISCKYEIERFKSEITVSENYINQLKGIIEDLSVELTNHNNTMTDFVIKEEILSENAKQLAIEEVTNKINETKFEANSLETKLHKLLQEISSNSTHIGILTERISSKKKDLAKLEVLGADLKVLEKELKLRQIVVQGFSSGGIPTMIIYSILDDLQIEANNFLHQLRPGLELQFESDTLAISYRDKGFQRSYTLLSGGQKVMVALALKIGLSMVIQHRLGVNIKFLELDEVDQPLDKSAVDTFADAIKKLQDRFKIFLITHNEHLKDKFSTAILVENDGINGATGKVVSSW